MDATQPAPDGAEMPPSSATQPAPAGDELLPSSPTQPAPDEDEMPPSSDTQAAPAGDELPPSSATPPAPAGAEMAPSSATPPAHVGTEMPPSSVTQLAPAGTPFSVGSFCTIQGLQSGAAQHLNGRRCEVRDFDKSAGRLCVRLAAGDGQAKWKKIKQENLQSDTHAIERRDADAPAREELLRRITDAAQDIGELSFLRLATERIEALQRDIAARRTSDADAAETAAMLVQVRRSALTRQLEFFLSDANLRHDKYLRGLIETDTRESGIPIHTLLGLNRLKQIGCRSPAEVVEAVEASPPEAELELTSNREGVRRRNRRPLPPSALHGSDTPSAVDDCTIRIENFSKGDVTVSTEAVRALLSEFGAISNIWLIRANGSLQTPVGETSEFLGAVEVEFGSKDAALKACGSMCNDVPPMWNDAPLRLISLANFRAECIAARSEKRPLEDDANSPAAKRARIQEEASVAVARFQRGVTLRLDGVPSRVSWKQIKEAFLNYGEVSFVDSEGQVGQVYVRMRDGEGAKRAVEGLAKNGGSLSFELNGAPSTLTRTQMPEAPTGMDWSAIHDAPPCLPDSTSIADPPGLADLDWSLNGPPGIAPESGDAVNEKEQADELVADDASRENIDDANEKPQSDEVDGGGVDEAAAPAPGVATVNSEAAVAATTTSKWRPTVVAPAREEEDPASEADDFERDAEANEGDDGPQDSAMDISRENADGVEEAKMLMVAEVRENADGADESVEEAADSQQAVADTTALAPTQKENDPAPVADALAQSMEAHDAAMDTQPDKSEPQAPGPLLKGTMGKIKPRGAMSMEDAVATIQQPVCPTEKSIGHMPVPPHLSVLPTKDIVQVPVVLLSGEEEETYIQKTSLALAERNAERRTKGDDGKGGKKGKEQWRDRDDGQGRRNRDDGKGYDSKGYDSKGFDSKGWKDRNDGKGRRDRDDGKGWRDRDHGKSKGKHNGPKGKNFKDGKKAWCKGGKY